MATATTEEIERIVRDVLAQLGAGTKPGDALADASPAVGAVVRDGDVVVDSRVVTLESIAGRLKGAKQVVVPPGALVTPSVHDELRRKGILLVQERRAASEPKGCVPVLLVVGRTRFDPAAAVESLARQGIKVQSETSECMIASTDKLAAAAASGKSLGVLWTRHTAAGLCLANRHAGVRAVLASGVAATAAAVSAVGANVLVVDPTVGTSYETNRILREFCTGGIRECPESLKERLGGSAEY
jgi:ribose 5-phosphate isomerase RpiB